LASFQHFWTPQLSSAITFDYAHASAGGGLSDDISAYQVYGNLVWSPVAGFMAGAEVGYNNVDAGVNGSADAWTGKIRLKRSW
jgi:hypothetical protein